MAKVSGLTIAFLSVIGIIVLVIGIILISVDAPNEIPLWYGITLCPTLANPALFISQNLPASGACPAALEANQTQSQEFLIQENLFSLQGLKYHPVFYRTTTAAALEFTLVDSKGKVIFTQQTVGTNDVDINGNNDYAVSSDEELGNGRKLMKGGRSSSPSGYRNNRGIDSRYGSAQFVSRTRYGSSSCCVDDGVTVFVYRPGPRTATGTYDLTSDPQYANCADPTNGCQFDLPDDMNRDEFETLYFVPRDDMDWPLKMTITRAETTKTDSQEPHLYFTFWTPDADNAEVAAYVMLPLGCLLVAIAIVLGFLKIIGKI